MKTRGIILIAFLASLTSAPLPAQNNPASASPDRAIDPTEQFIFLSVLEGLYEDGVSNEDVGQILLRREKEAYFHFIYSCPICNATIWALEAYQSRPRSLYGLKRESSTLGTGLPANVSAELRNDNPARRLAAINGLVKNWMERRIGRMNFTEAQRKDLTERLEKKREEGMKALEQFRKKEHGENFGVAQAAPAYVELKECAVCNAATGRTMNVPTRK